MTYEYARRQHKMTGFAGPGTIAAPEQLKESLRDDQSLALVNCTKCTLDLSIVKQVAALSIVECRDVGVVLGQCTGAVEIVRCHNVQLQCDAKSIQVDGCSNVTLFVKPEAREQLQVLSGSGSSQITISVPVDEFTDPEVHIIPQQFVTVFRNGHWETSAVKQ